MKKLSLLPIAVMIFAAFMFVTACKKSSSGTKYPSGTSDVLSDAKLDSLKSLGFVVNAGSNPPNIENIVYMEEPTLLVPYGPDDNYVVGEVIVPYKIKTYGQDGNKIKMDYKTDDDQDKASGVGCILTGTGNKFSLYSTVSGKADLGDGTTATYESAILISGELVADGIKNLQLANLITQKNDPDEILMPVGCGRIWFEADSLASQVSVYRLMNTAANGNLGQLFLNKKVK